MPKFAAARLRDGGLVSDREFDQVYAPPLRFVSQHHWTPVDVAVRAALLLADVGASRVLDVGAGPGKFCIVGALATQAHFTGLERRRHLVKAAELATGRFGVEHVRFVLGDIVDFAIDSFDGIYMYNPFYELIAPTLVRIDDDLEGSTSSHQRCVAAVVRKLARASTGTAVVTYHGFGGVMPAGYQRIHRENAGSDELVLWLKMRSYRRLPGTTPASGVYL
jgi:SAM-dependent methyltransferase